MVIVLVAVVVAPGILRIFVLLIVSIPYSTQAGTGKENPSYESSLRRGHVLAISGENQKVEDSQCGLHDHVGHNIKIQIPM